ncbi:MAG: hypothetical protein GXP27_17545 [Planctomycetes bacterium]|nr:hypothetical protein [Planctomycetota bacterium]
MEFSGDTWGELRRQLRQRRKRMGRAEDMIVGSVHGHNFGPALDEAGRKTCAVCSQRSACNRTTAVASLADIKWHFSVFAGQPWAILLVWGWNARDQEQWRVYGLESGTLMPRPIRLLPSSVAQLAAAERSQIG